MSGLGLAFCALVLAGAVREELPWYAWATMPPLLLVHDLTHGALRALTTYRTNAQLVTETHRSAVPPPATPGVMSSGAPMHALPALLLATMAASACAIVQSPASTPASIVAPVIAWLVPVLLMGAPPSAGTAWLARHARFGLATALAAGAAAQHTHVDVVAQFFLACLVAGVAEVVFAAGRAKAAR